MRILSLLFLLFLTACASQSPTSGYGSSSDFDPLEAAKTRISLGLTYLKNGNYTQAKFNLDKALEFAPRLADGHYSMAYYYQLVGETERARKHYESALDFAPRNADIANSYGAFLCQQGEYDIAKHFFLKAVNSQNYSAIAETYENLAICSQSQGKVEDALEYFQSAINHQPSRTKTLILLAELQASQSLWVDAKTTVAKLERVGRVTPDTLYLAAEVESALGNHQAAKDYGNMLLKMYPEHPNSKRYLTEVRPVAPTLVRNNTQNQPVKPISAAAPVEQLKAEGQDEHEAELTNQPVYHVVKKDENLYRISLQYNIRMQKLIEWNQLQDASSIYAGKKLHIVDPNTTEK